MHWYVTRLCWNTKRWQCPSGDADETNSFREEHGFGFEEWLFAPLLYEGWCYGFVQGVNRRHDKAVQERDLCLLFYSERPPRTQHERFFVAQMRCEVLAKAEAGTAYNFFDANGTIARLKNEVLAVKGKPDPPFANAANDPLEILNVRYRPENAVVYPQLVRVPAALNFANPDFRRYDLHPANDYWL